MELKPFLWAVSILFLFSNIATAQDEDKLEQVDADIWNHAYCFRFTWMGPNYRDLSQIQNRTCADLLEDTKRVPCKHPLTYTDNQREPNTSYVWELVKASSKPEEFACRLGPSEYCIKYSYTFKGAFENITYMCGKVKLGNESSRISGCYEQEENGRVVEVCVCESRAGREPCNSGTVLNWNVHMLLLALASYLVINSFLRRQNYVKAT